VLNIHPRHPSADNHGGLGLVLVQMLVLDHRVGVDTNISAGFMVLVLGRYWY
jgi:hypothetical protein